MISPISILNINDGTNTPNISDETDDIPNINDGPDDIPDVNAETDDIPNNNDGTDDDDDNEQYLPFRGVEDFFAQVDACAKETFLIFSPVSAAEYETIFKSRELQGRKFRMDLWDGKKLRITAHVSGPHERLHRYLDEDIQNRVLFMGLKKEWTAMGSQKFKPGGSGNDGEGGEADSSRKPESQRPSATAWPTLVIEGGYSQSIESLRVKADWWLKEFNFEVKIVLLAKLSRSSRTILVEKWVGVPPEPETNSPNVITRARQRLLDAQAQTQTSGPLVPGKVQTITITPVAGVNPHQTPSPNSFQVVGSPLVLEFSLLFLRQPGPGEGDILYGVQELQEFAEAVWRAVV